MRLHHLPYLRCPKSGTALVLQNETMTEDRVQSGELVSQTGERYPIVNFIPRFVDADNYAANFGFEWQVHARTQFDQDAGHKMSEERFFGVTRWGRALAGEVILEAGSGSGRFTEQAVSTGATVLSFDYSQAVEVNYKSNGHNPNLLIVQANIYEIPFEKASFDKVFCLGVLQHTPDPHASFKCLVDMLKPGGNLASDIYLKTFKRYYLNTRYWVRPFTRNANPQRLYSACKRYIDIMWPLARIIRRIPRVGETILWRLLIADYSNQMPHASDDTLREWAYLDTFDMLSPRYDIPQTPVTFRQWHEQAGLKNIAVGLGPNGVIGIGQKPA